MPPGPPFAPAPDSGNARLMAERFFPSYIHRVGQVINTVHQLSPTAGARLTADGKLVTETLDDTPWPSEQLVPVEAEAGTLVVFDGRAPHLSAANRSPRSRHAYTLHVIDRTCHYPADNWLQRSPELPLRGFEEKFELKL